MKHFALIALLLPGFAFAADLAGEIEWPTTYSDGTPALPAEFADALLQIGTCADPAIPTFGAVNKTLTVPYPTTDFLFTGMANGQYCIRGYARMVDTTRNSNASNVLAVKLTNARVSALVLRLKLP